MTQFISFTYKKNKFNPQTTKPRGPFIFAHSRATRTPRRVNKRIHAGADAMFTTIQIYCTPALNLNADSRCSEKPHFVSDSIRTLAIRIRERLNNDRTRCAMRATLSRQLSVYIHERTRGRAAFHAHFTFIPRLGRDLWASSVESRFLTREFKVAGLYSCETSVAQCWPGISQKYLV